MKISYISLGCPKNEVDLEYILGGLAPGAEIINGPEQANVVIINTCAFINDAKQESIDHILTALEKRKTDPHYRVLVTGCLPQRYKKELREAIPEIDEFFSSLDIKTTLRQIQDHLQMPPSDNGLRNRVTPKHFAYLKIAEGCNNRCSYCAIPLIKGEYVSQPFEGIIAEAERLVQDGARELMLVAQDTTMYGRDLKSGKSMVNILTSLNEIKGLDWIRLLYTHPAHWQDDMVQAVAGLDKVVKYIDLPVQHISDPILKSMGRHTTRKEMETLIEKFRTNIPGLTLRTSVITGYPGETEADFRELVDFIENVRFERLGAFTYSQEEGTRAASLADNVPEELKQDRMQEIMELQADITLFNNKQLIGRTEKVLIDEIHPELNVAAGRTYRDAPDIDNTVLLPLEVGPGDMVDARFVKADIYDLHAEIL